MNQLEMFLKEVARLIHVMIASLHLVASREASSKTIDQAYSNEVTSYLDGTTDGTTDHLRSIVLGKVVGHRMGDQGKSPEPAGEE